MAYFLCNGGFKSLINITSTANATVTATTTGATYTAVCDSSGYAQIKVKKKGEYNITSTGTTKTAHATVVDKNPVTAVYYWNKWNALANYASYIFSSGSSSGDVQTRLDSGVYIMYWGTGQYFDSSTGNFVLTGVGSTYGFVNFNDGIHYFISNASAKNVMWNMWSRDSGYPGGSVKIADNQFSVFRGTWNGYTSYISYYYKGTTDYGRVTGTTINAHPDNDRDSNDGYWYVAA